LACAARSPSGLPATLNDVGARVSLGIVWWASIVLTSMPFVTAGAIAASLAGAIPRLRGYGAPLAAMLAPGCDCSLAGLASSLRRAPPAVAGFAIAWGAIAGPSALIATRAAGGNGLLEARLVGALVTAALTALSWGLADHRVAAHACATHERPAPIVERIFAALGGLGASALGATVLLVAAPGAVEGSTSPFAAALVAAVLSPCSTADAVLARVLLHDRASQAAFVIAAQSIDVRQLSTIKRVFGWRCTLLALIAGCAGCAAAALAAR